MRTPDVAPSRSRQARPIVAAAAAAAAASVLVLSGAAAGAQETPAASSTTTTGLAPAAVGYDVGLSNVPTAFTIGDTQATFTLTVCNQGTVNTGPVVVQYAVPTGAGYVNPVSGNNDGRLLEVNVADLAPGASSTFPIVVGFAQGQSSPLITAAEVITDSGTDVDSTESADPITFGSANEDDRLSSTDACGSETDASEDDRDIAVLDLQAGIPTTTAPTTTAPPPSSLVTVITTVPGPGVSPNTLPATGTPDSGARSPLTLLAVALPVAWLGTVLSLRSRRLQATAR
ncbi:MAG: hypothetical protein R2749_27620 [Acidimicrobiales bacterium]